MTLKPLNFLTHKETTSRYNISRKKHIYITDKKYIVKLAENFIELDEALKLRFTIFNLELHEGLDSSFLTLRDEDNYDKQCSHMLVIEKVTGNIIGTYRLQTFEHAKRGFGFYSANEFRLQTLGRKILRRAVELGRACIDQDHRNGRVLFLLWKGIAQYMLVHQKRYLFGCCSITSQDPVEGKIYMDFLERHGYVHTRVHTEPTPGYRCYGPHLQITPTDNLILPPLMDMYLRYGCKVCGLPAIDREFKTIDFLVFLDIQELKPEIYRLFF
ncbi:MAG: GNAT family N-acetyltransferase [Bacteroidales bacterium]|nr:GNAT family N-acetyltransferase [Bacteroidales bacterium]